MIFLRATQIIASPSYRAGGRVVECTGLENRRTLTGLVGSNPTLPVVPTTTPRLRLLQRQPGALGFRAVGSGHPRRMLGTPRGRAVSLRQPTSVTSPAIIQAADA